MGRLTYQGDQDNFASKPEGSFKDHDRRPRNQNERQSFLPWPARVI